MAGSQAEPRVDRRMLSTLDWRISETDTQERRACGRFGHWMTRLCVHGYIRNIRIILTAFSGHNILVPLFQSRDFGGNRFGFAPSGPLPERAIEWQWPVAKWIGSANSEESSS